MLSQADETHEFKVEIAVAFPQRQSQPELDVHESPFQLPMQLSAHDGPQAKAAEVKRAVARMVDFILARCL